MNEVRGGVGGKPSKATKREDDVERIFVGPEEITRRMTAKALGLFTIDPGGNLILSETIESIQDKYVVGLIVLGQYLRLIRGDVITDEISNRAISAQAGIKIDVVNARLAELRKGRYVTSPRRGLYRFVPMKAEEFLRKARMDVGWKSEE